MTFIWNLMQATLKYLSSKKYNSLLHKRLNSLSITDGEFFKTKETIDKEWIYTF